MDKSEQILTEIRNLKTDLHNKIQELERKIGLFNNQTDQIAGKVAEIHRKTK